MRNLIVLIVTSFMMVNYTLSNTSSIDLEFNFDSKLNCSTPFIHVEFNFKSDSNGLIVLIYENNSWGDKDIFNCLNKFDVSPKPQNIKFERDSNQIIIKTSPYTKSTIQYEIIQDYKGPPLNQFRYRPIIDSTYFHILGRRLFIVPERVFITDTSKANIRIQYKQKEGKELFHSSFGKKNIQNIAVTRENLYASFFVGGDFRRYSFTLENDRIYFITRGNWKAFKDSDILNILEESICSQRSFWNDTRKGDFSVSLIPTFEEWYSIGGSGFSNSFISFASNNNNVTLSQMKWLYNHELLHKWIGRTIINENEVEQYWFSEGFTDYYAYKLLLKSKSLSISEYIDIINKEIIIPHYQDSLNTIPNKELTFETYWSNYAKYEKIPYRRGLLYAFHIDNQIKEQSNYSLSLDNLMLDLFNLAIENKSMRLNNNLFLEKLNKYLKPNKVKSDFNKYIIEGELIDFEDKLPNGIGIEYKDTIPVLKINKKDLTQIQEILAL